MIANEFLSPIVELRQYTLRRGTREVLIELFARALSDGQEACGMDIIGEFRDLDRPDRFVWLRGFADLDARRTALTAFYKTGAVWKEHAPAARATMVDTDDALLLRPCTAQSAFARPDSPRPAQGATVPSSARFAATLYHRDEPVDDEFRAFWEQRVHPLVSRLGAPPLAWFETEPAENTFPDLPIRAGEHIFVWFARFGAADELEAHQRALDRSSEWTAQVLPELKRRLAREPEQLRLEPTLRSWLR